VSLTVVWSALARRRLKEIYEHVAKDKPFAAERLAIRIVAAVQVLKRYPSVGRLGRDFGTRELVIGRTPYIVSYEVHETEVRIVTIWHGAQHRES